MTTAAYDRLIAQGSGKIGARLQIAGLPYEAVTHATMSRGDTGDGFQRIVGLMLSGITLSEKVSLSHATCEPGSFTATIVDAATSVEASEAPWTYLFSRRPTQRTWTSATNTDVSATIDVLSTDGFASAGYIWIDQEAIKYTAISGVQFQGCTRGALGTLATYHYSLDTSGARATEVTNWPQTAEGRHARLYLYAEGDTLTGDGTQVWIGILSRDARLGDEASTWQLGIDPITRLFQQTLGGDLAGDVPAGGIYYPWVCGFHVDAYVSTTSATSGLPTVPTLSFTITGQYADQDAFVAAVNAQITGAAATAGLTCISDLAAGFHFELISPAAGQRWVALNAFSPIDNVHYAGSAYGLFGADGITVTADATTAVTAATQYLYGQRPYGTSAGSVTFGWQTVIAAIAAPGSVPRGAWSSNNSAIWGVLPQNVKSADSSTAPGRRFYLGGSEDLTNIATVSLDMGTAPQLVLPVTPNVAGRYIDTGIPASASDQFALMFAGAGVPRFTPTRMYVNGGTLNDMIKVGGPLNVAALSGGPLGTAPYVDTFDFADSTTAITAAAGSASFVSQRIYSSSRPIKLGDFLSAECQNIGCFIALNASGRIAVWQVGIAPTGTTRTIDATAELSSAHISAWERNALGSLAEISYATFYDPATDKFLGATFDYEEVTTRGRNPSAETLKVEPKSASNYRATLFMSGGVLGIPPAIAATISENYAAVASAVLGIYGYPYDTITVAVPFTLFAALCGDSVSITSKNLPAGDGKRGMSSRSGIIIGRSWDLASDTGELTCLCSEINYAGYTPTSRVSSQADNGGNKWTLTIATPAVGPTVSYSLATVWATNDLVRVVLWNATTAGSGIVTGTVVSTTATTVQVQFTGVWVPGASTWNLEYGLSSAPWQTSQQALEGIADSTGRLTYSAATVARQFAP